MSYFDPAILSKYRFVESWFEQSETKTNDELMKLVMIQRKFDQTHKSLSTEPRPIATPTVGKASIQQREMK